MKLNILTLTAAVIIITAATPFARAQSNNPVIANAQQDIAWCQEQVANLERGIASYRESQQSLQYPNTVGYRQGMSAQEEAAFYRQYERSRTYYQQKMDYYNGQIADNQRAMQPYAQRIARDMTAIANEQARVSRSGEYETDDLREIQEKQAARRAEQLAQEQADRADRAEGAKLNEANAMKKMQDAAAAQGTDQQERSKRFREEMAQDQQRRANEQAARIEAIRRMGEEAVRQQREASEKALRDWQENQRRRMEEWNRRTQPQR